MTEDGKGVRGRLPAWPRQALNSSVIAAEQAYRKRSSLPLLTDADIEALKAGQPMWWEQEGGTPPAAAAPAAPAAVVAAAPPPAAPAAALVVSEEVQKIVAQGKKWSKSSIAAEQAKRKRNNAPALNDAEVAALLGEPYVPSAAPAASAAVAAPVAAAPVASAPVVYTVGEEVKKMVALGKKWSKSSIAAEQAKRKRNNLPPFNEAEVAALLGEPYVPGAAATPAPAVAVAVTAAPVAARPAAASPAVPQGTSVARSGVSTSYVGTPAVGTSKAARAGGVASVGPEDNEINQGRRRFAWAAVAAFLTAWFLAFFRFFLPRTLFEPATSFKIGYPEDYGLGVDTKWQQRFRIWVDKTPDRIFVIYARCTHLGCTPDWKPSENKFKCPCHGSGYDSEGINFEGPAPRPMDRAHVEVAPDGQILVDVSKLYQWPKGQPTQFNDDGAYLRT